MANKRTAGTARPTQLFGMRTRVLLRDRGGLWVIVALLVALAPATAQAAAQTRDDPSDAPAGAFGKADLRQLDWDVGAASATLTVGIEASTYGTGERALIGVHVLLDADNDGIADHEIVATRNVDGVTVDLVLRDLDRTLSTGDCQDLAGAVTAAQSMVTTTLANGLETFTFSFDPTLVSGSLASSFRWAAFGQAPPDGSQAGPWDVMPDAANPDPAAANPGDRRCNGGETGLRVRMSNGIAFPDAGPAPEPTPTPAPEPLATPAPTPLADITKPTLGAVSLSQNRFRAAYSGPSIATVVGTTVSFALSEAAAVKFRIGRALLGRRVGGRCVAPTHGNRRATECTRYKTLRGSFIYEGSVGSNSFRFVGRLRGRKLQPGRYRLLAVATDHAGNKSRLKQGRFQIVRR